MSSELAEYPIQVTIPIQWAEMDAYGHVNNAIFFRYFEVARIELLARIGFIETFDSVKISAILHSTSCRFKAPLKYPDTITVGTRVSDISADRFTLDYVIVSGDGTTAATGESVVVSYDYEEEKKAPLPPTVRQNIEAMGSS